MIAPQPRIAILGIGAIGSVITKELHKQFDISLYSRTAKQEINISDPNGKYSIPLQTNKNLPPDNIFDWLFVCLKEHQIKEALSYWHPLLSRQTKVVIIRNGINHKNHFLNYTSDLINRKLLNISIDY